MSVDQGFGQIAGDVPGDPEAGHAGSAQEVLTARSGVAKAAALSRPRQKAGRADGNAPNRAAALVLVAFLALSAPLAPVQAREPSTNAAQQQQAFWSDWFLRFRKPSAPQASPSAASAPDSGLEHVALGTLPDAAQSTFVRILSGGPFWYDKDGSVFANRERILPAAQRGHYREYTVTARAQRSRGARRIVCGGAEPTRPQACFYTDDHYASFRQIVP